MIEVSIREGDDVMTADNVRLGVARSLHYRPFEEVNPEEQLYAVYLKVVNFELGDELYIPVEFLDVRESEDEPVTLTVPVKVVMKRSWSRAPKFVAMMQGRTERLGVREYAPAT